METPQNIRQKILSFGKTGKLFSVTFIKKNGEERRMVCRLGVRKGVKGVELDRQKKDKKLGYLTVYDFNADRTLDSKGGFRRINLRTITKVRLGKVEYTRKACPQ